MWNGTDMALDSFPEGDACSMLGLELDTACSLSYCIHIIIEQLVLFPRDLIS